MKCRILTIKIEFELKTIFIYKNNKKLIFVYLEVK